MGAGPFTYPEEAGLEIGGPDFNQFVLLEVHYNNQAMEKGWKYSPKRGRTSFVV